MDQVYAKGDAHTPYRFWEYALVTSETDPRYVDYLKKQGFKYSDDDTKLYHSLSEEQQKKINFYKLNITFE